MGLPDLGGFHGKLVQHIFAYAHGLNTVGEAEWVAKVPRLLCRDGWPHASVVAPGAAHRARVARNEAARAALAMQVPRAKDAPREKLALEKAVNVMNAQKDSFEPAA